MYPSILTNSGQYFDFHCPEHSNVSIKDIAHALSHTCRFAGHVETFYSVAQHCVLVSHLVPAEDALCALLHDAHEAFIGDVPAPLKLLLPDYECLEKRVQSVVLDRFGIYRMPGTVKHADLVALVTEKRHLMPDDGIDWELSTGVKATDYRILTLPPVHAKQQFLARFYELGGSDA